MGVLTAMHNFVSPLDSSFTISTCQLLVLNIVLILIHTYEFQIVLFAL